ncbi:MAG: hypothetical protein GX133_07020 [Syntrophomonadaceae bacterium]|nr:hypothetical protein [Syntrophomonadaceae bacterium]
MAKKKPKYYVRPDGLHEAIRVINGKRVPFRGRSDAQVERKMIEYKAKIEQGPLFNEVGEPCKEQHFAKGKQKPMQHRKKTIITGV